MKRSDQAKYATSFSKSILRQFMQALDAGEVPEEWDGHEIKQWFADTVSRERTDPMKGRKRLKEYRETVARGRYLQSPL